MYLRRDSQTNTGQLIWPKSIQLNVYVVIWNVEYTLQDLLLRLQAKRTACERKIGASLALEVDASVSENVQGC